MDINRYIRLNVLNGLQNWCDQFQFVQPNPIHSQTLRNRAFGLFLWKGRMNAKKLGFEHNIIHKLVCKHGIAPRKIAVTCNPLLHQGRVCHRGASKLANTKSAAELACRHMMTSQFRSERGKTRKREISRDFSRFFDPAFFRSFIDPFRPFRCCVRTRTHEKG